MWVPFFSFRFPGFASKDSMRGLRNRLRKCTRILLRLAWQKHKAACVGKSQRHKFWTILEARMVLSAWKTEKLIRYDSDTVNGDIDMFSRDFLSIVERAGQVIPPYTSQSMVNIIIVLAYLQTYTNTGERALSPVTYTGLCMRRGPCCSFCNIIRRERWWMPRSASSRVHPVKHAKS